MKVKCRIQWCSWAFHIEMYSQIGRDKILKMKKRGGDSQEIYKRAEVTGYPDACTHIRIFFGRGI